MNSAVCRSAPRYITSFVPSQLNHEPKEGCLLTCKCPWYILSIESVADLSVSGCLDFFQTCECQTGSVDMKSWSRVFGQEVRRSTQSGAVLSSGAEADTSRSSRISLRVTPRRKRSATSDRTIVFGGVIKKEGKNKSPRFKSSFWDALPFSRSLSSSVGLSPRLSLPSLLSSSLGYGLNVFSLLGVQSLLIVRSSFLFANCSPWPSPLVPPPVLTCSTRRHARTFHFRACSERHTEKCPELIN